MKTLIVLSLLLISITANALTVTQAFTNFYNNEVIDSNKCGVNTQLFIRYLNQNKVEFNSGYVVSIHEPYASLNHFDSRWGSNEEYQNGVPFRRSNWYFHVFAVIDGKAYDFSQSGPKVMPIRQYLRVAYLPAYKTKNIFIQGSLTSRTQLRKYQNFEMNLYSLNEYSINYRGKFYSGEFIELFNL
jgi:hypothetical protein